MIEFGGQANYDEILPKSIEVNTEQTAVRFRNAHNKILLFSEHGEEWLAVNQSDWKKLLDLCNPRTGWVNQGRFVYLHNFPIHKFANPTDEVEFICSRIIKTLNEHIPIIPTFFRFCK